MPSFTDYLLCCLNYQAVQRGLIGWPLTWEEWERRLAHGSPAFLAEATPLFQALWDELSHCAIVLDSAADPSLLAEE